MRLSFLGLGAMGFPMAGHLARHGHSVAVWNRTRAVTEKHAAEHGTRELGDVSEAGGSDVVFSCVPTSREVDELVAQVLPGLGAGSIWVDCTSGDPGAAATTAAELGQHQVAFLDAPVSGGVSAAEAGTLTVMVGGEPEALERAREAIAAFASNIFHVGPSGSGHALKAVNNTLLAIHILAAGEGLAALEKFGIPPARALEVLNTSSGRSHVSEKLLPEPLLSGEFPVTFKLGLLAKDVGIGARVIAESVATALAPRAAELLGDARDERGGDVDYLELVKR